MSKIILNLTQEASDILDASCRRRGISTYVSRLVADAREEWRAAAKHMLDIGLAPSEVMAVCRVVAGKEQPDSLPANLASKVDDPAFVVLVREMFDRDNVELARSIREMLSVGLK